MTPTPDGSPQILVVDDEPFLVQLLAEMLEAEGYQVDTAANGLLALEQIDGRSYDLILSDLRMPDLDGLGLYQELQTRRPELLRRLIFISGTSEELEYAGFIEQTDVPVLSKPFHLEDLRRLAERVLAAP